MAGPPDDLAGFGQGGALAVLAVLHLSVVAVVGAVARAWVLPVSDTAQRSTGGPCRDSRPGRPLRSEDQTVMSSPVNRTALREEENRSAPPSQQVSGNAVTGPTPYSRAARTFAPVRCRAAASTCLRSASMRASRAASMSTAVATCTCRSYCSATAKCRVPRSLALRARPSSDLPAARGCLCPALHRAANTGHGLVPSLRSRRSPPHDAVDGLVSRDRFHCGWSVSRKKSTSNPGAGP